MHALAVNSLQASQIGFDENQFLLRSASIVILSDDSDENLDLLSFKSTFNFFRIMRISPQPAVMGKCMLSSIFSN